MFIPDPLLALVVSYHTDGKPARRALAGCRRDQVVKGWKTGDTVEYCMWVANGTWFSNWGAVRRALDIAAYVVARETGEREHAMYIAFLVPDSTTRNNTEVAQMRRALRGEWTLFPRHPHIENSGHKSMFYDYYPRLYVHFMSVSLYLQFCDYPYFIALLDINGCSPEQLKELQKIQAEGRGLIM